MRGIWGHAKLLGGACAAAMIAISPAISAMSDLLSVRQSHPVSLDRLGSIGSFTPASMDARLARSYIDSIRSTSGAGFRFTPTSGSVSGRRSITVAVRAGGDSTLTRSVSAIPSLNVAPVAFTLGRSRGLQRFALTDAVSGRTGVRDEPIVSSTLLKQADSFVLPNEKPSRFSTNVEMDGRHDVGTAPQAIVGDKLYSVDLASSYAVTKNLNLTAGVRYRGTDNRLLPVSDERQDSQAVYVGTKFKF